ncbi:hypothetical protein NLI96_g10143 [Meripilus lineatus]|uniref:ATP-dependent RNA helicase n=1 Tax=Meripilus lineatus TaxID=2056292 RepID=A0AAD5UWF7_9APHY|nr:hypothetical protein NLI96_g10143 [Physisporinus lineatus]
MDDGIVLNLAGDDDTSSSKSVSVKKGGRWTDRLKAKRVAKRKVRHDEVTEKPHSSDAAPNKKRRKETHLPDSGPTQSTDPIPSGSRPPTQIISSLFTSNPKVEVLPSSTSRHRVSKPSNAPLTDSSTFPGLGLDPLIANHLSNKMNITKPTSIQRAVLPAMFSGSEEDVSSRDVFIQAQTGSGKTLAFLLPILQDLLPLSSHSYIDRSIGTLAIIIAPTRELAKQISDVLESLLKLRLRQTDEVPDDAESSAPRLTRWLVSGLLSGGATRTHEKARLRKGLPILVSTPGRLLDHLQNTSSLNVGKCRWLVLDEADRLMDLGFEETIQGIIKGLDGRRNLAKNAVEEGKSMEVGGWDWERRRRTILCSATIRDDVQKLAGTTLLDPLMIKATNDETVNPIVDVTGSKLGTAAVEEKFTPPSQLSQKYVVIPLKLRLVALIALLRSLLTQSQGRKGTKIIVFLSCTDSVDFHWNLLGGMSMSSDGSNESSDGEQSSDEEVDKPTKEKVALQSTLLPDTSIYRLHGSLPLQTRLSSLRGFSSSPKPGSESSAKSSILLCTSVASRGLDLPLVRAVVQYDLPTESGATEYVHRVGRTARAGKGGEAWSFVAPSEVEWVKWVTERMRGASEVGNDTKSASLEAVGVDSVLQNGFGGKGSEYEDRATEVQLSFERWVLKKNQNAEFARKAFLSHIRAYATHPSDEKHMFHIRHLHLGHLAKAFALREAPAAVKNSGNKTKNAKSRGKSDLKTSKPAVAKGGKEAEWTQDNDAHETERRMEKVVREQGRLTKKGGKMVSSGTAEFQIASGNILEQMGYRT